MPSCLLSWRYDVICPIMHPDQSPPRVAFGSGVERKMFPMHHAPTRFGIETGIRGQPHMGPGRYSPDPVRYSMQLDD